jgi:hypothetical protein
MMVAILFFFNPNFYPGLALWHSANNQRTLRRCAHLQNPSARTPTPSQPKEAATNQSLPLATPADSSFRTKRIQQLFPTSFHPTQHPTQLPSWSTTSFRQASNLPPTEFRLNVLMTSFSNVSNLPPTEFRLNVLMTSFARSPAASPLSLTTKHVPDPPTRYTPTAQLPLHEILHRSRTQRYASIATPLPSHRQQ